MGKWSELSKSLPPLPPQGDAGYAARVREAADALKGLTLDTLTERLNGHRDDKDWQEQQLKDTEFQIAAVTTALTEKLEQMGLDRVTANGYTYTPSPEPYPKVEDKPAFLAWVNEHMPENLTLPHPTLAGLVKAALAPGGSNEIPPGVGVYLKPGLRRTKAR